VEHVLHTYRIGGVPVVDAQRRLIGLITNRDLRFEPDETRRVH
jgi:IMP dehydrogenase